MKELKIIPPEGYIIDEEQSTIFNIVFKKKNELPATWEEFCKQNSDIRLEYYISGDSKIHTTTFLYKNIVRTPNRDENLLSTKKDAEAHLALIQLHRLRDVYRQGWIPDWKNSIQSKYIITHYSNNVNIIEVGKEDSFLSFQSKEIAKQFLENFKDLITKAKELI